MGDGVAKQSAEFSERIAEMKFLSLFSGIGGFDLGLERAGMECVGQVEFNTFCQRVLAKHWPNVKRMGDIHGVRGTEFGAVELICGGFPCQPFSTAGRQRGTDDSRHLWPEMFRIIQTIRPRWVIGENVRGLLGIQQGMVFEQVCLDLEGIGYEVRAFVIPAAGINAPHRRDRVWIIGRNTASNAPDTECMRELQPQGIEQNQRGWPCHGDQNAPDTGNQGLQGSKETGDACGCGANTDEFAGGHPVCSLDAFPDSWNIQWIEVALTTCNVRVDDGLPAGVDGVKRRVKNYRADRLKVLGNAVVPQIVEEIGRAIMMAERIPR
jgi:DNA (cytosine-5)-methyltransferase 1